jgi:undecaprenyl-diphosphatase
MNLLDSTTFTFLGNFVGHHSLVDQGMILIADNNLFHGGIVGAMFWWAWFDRSRYGEGLGSVRKRIVSAIFCSIIVLILTRFLVAGLPFRARPLNDPQIHVHFPIAPSDWLNWTSFPSDHALLYFFFATVFFRFSPIMGVIAALDALCLVCVPRVYLGIHFPTDIIGGGLIGVIFALAADRPAISERIGQPSLNLLERFPSLFYSAFFLFTYEVINELWDVTHFLHQIAHVLHKYL